MVKKLECPPANVLEELIGGKLVDPELRDLSEHLEDCVACQERARTLAPHDTLVEALRGESAAADAIARDIPRPLVEKIKQLPKQHGNGNDTVVHAADASPTPGDADIDFLKPPQQADEIGRLGTYRVLKVLGKGGMGVVFLADDPELDRKVALKVMLPKIAANPQAKQRFLREARAAAKLKSDHIVTIYQVAEDRGVPFLAMELLEGLPLDGFLQAGKNLSLPQVLRIGREIAKGLVAAHDKGLVHRDIKPANLWLDQAHGGRVKILDFGLARAQQDDIHLTQAGAIVGTPAYMAPEQAQGDKQVDARADLFSLGCVLYRLCAGDIPFKGETTMGVLIAIATNDPTPPVKINDKIPPALSELIMKLLEKNAAKRPVSAREVVARLQEIEKAVAALRNDLQKNDAGKISNDATNIDLSLSLPPMAEVLPAPGLLTALEQAKAEAKATTAPTAPPRKRRPVFFAAMVLLGLFVIGGAGTWVLMQMGVIRFSNEQGDYVITTDDPDFAFSVTKGGVILEDRKTKRKYNLKVVGGNKAAGEHELEVTDIDAELSFKTKNFTIKRGQEVALKAWFERKQVAGVEPPLSKPLLAIAPFDSKKARAYQHAWATHLGREVQFKNSLGITMVLIPAGEFSMGSDAGLVKTIEQELKAINADKSHLDGLATESPHHRVRLSRPFEISAHEITVAQFRRFVEETKYQTDAERDGKGGQTVDPKTRVHRNDPKVTWKNPVSYPAKDDLPVTQVSWNDADAFCRWLSQKEKRTYRLPTEAEWEFSCRAGTASRHTFGDNEFAAKEYVVLGEKPEPVGMRKANAFGIFDLEGNVFEWCRDWVRSYDPFAQTDPTGDAKGTHRVFRGGSYLMYLQTCRPASRFSDLPAARTADTGFRVVCEVKGEGALAVVDPPVTSTDYALRFDEASRVDLPKIPLSAETPFTLEAWVTPDTPYLKQQATILGMLDVAELRTNSTGAVWYFHRQGWSVSTGNSKAGLGANRPVHLAGVFTGKEVLLYVDGKLIDKKTVKKEQAKAVRSSVLGGNWPGLIDEVRISKVARYEKNFEPAKRFEPDPDTLALYHFDEGEGDVLKDSSGNGHHGKIVGAKWVKADGTAIAPPVDYALAFDGNGVVHVPTLNFDKEKLLTLEAFVKITPDTNRGVYNILGDRHVAWGQPNNQVIANFGHAANWVGHGSTKRFDQRKHIAAVLTEDSVVIFIDGKRYKEALVKGTVRMKSKEFQIGGLQFEGVIGEVRISKAVRYTKDFIPAHRFTPDADTLALYHFDEGQGDVLKDSSGNRHHGKIVGAKWVKADGAAIAPVYVPVTIEEKEAKKLQADWAAKLNVSVVEKSKVVGIEMVLIPPGGEALPKPYLLGKYEVTQGEWEAVMGYNPSHFKKLPAFSKDTDTSRLPVDTVSWYDSVEFCNKLSEKEGLKPYYALEVTKRGTSKQIDEAKVNILGGTGYHIPTEAEWEHGCRAGTKTKYYCGDSDEALLEHAWFDKNSGARSHPVGKKKPNAFGLYDMHGNMWEWNEETYAKGAPERVFRGGNWNSTTGLTAVSHRNLSSPAPGSAHLGLRLARVPGGATPPVLITTGTPKLLNTFKPTSATPGLVAFTKDGSQVIFSGGLLHFYDAVTGTIVGQEIPDKFKTADKVMITALSVAADGKSLVYSGIQDKSFFTRVLELPSRKMIAEFSPKYIQFGAALSPDGKTLVYGDEAGLIFRDVLTGKTEVGEKAVKDFLYMGLKYSPDGQYLTAIHYDNKNSGKQQDLVIFDANKRIRIAHHDIGGFSDWLDISSDGKWVALGGRRDNKAAWHLFSLPEGKLVHIERDQPARVFCGAFSPDGAYLALGTGDGAVQVWDTATKKLTLSWKASKRADAKFLAGIASLAFSPDGKTLATSAGFGEIHLWDLTKADDPDRRAAEWVIRQNGAVNVLLKGNITTVSSNVGKLPAGEPYNVQMVSFVLRPSDEKEFACLNGLPALTHLVFPGAAITDAALAELKELPALTTLTLSGTQITDAGVEYCARYPKLVDLALHKTAVTDKCIPALTRLTGLKSLDIRATKITAAGVKLLVTALPGCRIEHDAGVESPRAAIDPDRRAAEWVLSTGNAVEISEGGKTRRISRT